MNRDKKTTLQEAKCREAKVILGVVAGIVCIGILGGVAVKSFDIKMVSTEERIDYVDIASDGGYFVAGSEIDEPGESGERTVRFWHGKVSSQGTPGAKSMNTGIPGTRISRSYAGFIGLHGDAVVRLDDDGREVQTGYLPRSDGNRLEAKVASKTSDEGLIVAADRLRNPPGSREQDCMVFRMSPKGTSTWSTLFRSSKYCSSAGIEETVEKGFIVTGSEDSLLIVLGLDNKGSATWQKKFEGFSLVPSWDDKYLLSASRDGNHLVVASIRVNGKQDNAVLMIKMTPRGNVLWQKKIDGGMDVRALDGTTDGGWILAGSASSPGTVGWDAWLAKISAEGAIEWQRTYRISGRNNARSVRQTVDGGYIVAVNVSLRGEYSGTWALIKLDAAGNPVCKDRVLLCDCPGQRSSCEERLICRYGRGHGNRSR